MMIFCKFENGRKSGLDAADAQEALGFVKGVQIAAMCLETRAWIAKSLPNEAGVDNDSWLNPAEWLAANE